MRVRGREPDNHNDVLGLAEALSRRGTGRLRPRRPGDHPHTTRTAPSISGPRAAHVDGQVRLAGRQLHGANGAQVADLVGLNLLDGGDERGQVGQSPRCARTSVCSLETPRRMAT